MSVLSVCQNSVEINKIALVIFKFISPWHTKRRQMPGDFLVDFDNFSSC